MEARRDPLRVCLLTESFHPIVGGGETHARLLAEALIERGVDTFVLTQRRPRGTARRETVGRVPVVRVTSGGDSRWGKYLMLIPALSALLALRERYDLVYVCGLRTLGVPALAAGALLGRPVVLRAESRTELSGEYVFDEAPVLLRSLARGALTVRNRLYRRAAGYVALGEAIAEEFRSCRVPDERIHLIHNGIDTYRFRPPRSEEKTRLRSRLGLPSEAKVVVYTGKLNRGKGLQMLLRAWDRLVAAPDAASEPHLVLVGGGEHQYLSCEEELRDLVARRGLESRVTFTGYVENVVDFLRASDVFTLPSESEALPLSLLEGLACGLPAVVTDAGGIPEVVEDAEHGVVVPVNDEDAYLEALSGLLSDPEARSRMGRAGRRRVEERFGIAAVAEAHERLFLRLLGRPGSA